MCRERPVHHVQITMLNCWDGKINALAQLAEQPVHCSETVHLAKDRRTDKTWSYLGSGGDEIRDRPTWWRDGPTMGPVLVHLDGSWSRTQKKLWGELSWGGSGVLLEPYEHLSASQPLVTWKEEQARGLKHSGCVTPGNDFLHLKIIRLKTEMTSPFKKKNK